MAKIKLKIEGMHCPKCVAKTKESLESIEGVKSADVNLDKGLAVVEYEGDIPEEKFTMAVIDAGFKAKVKHGLF
jgi:copper chaperone